MRKALGGAVLLVAAATALTLSACGSSGGSSATSTSSSPNASGMGTATAPGNATSGTISFWSGTELNAQTGKDMRADYVAAFNKQYPNIKVNLITAPQDTDTARSALTTQISGGAGPDVFLGDVAWPAQFAAHGLAVNLGQYLPKSYWDTFANGLVAGLSYQGNIYAAPWFQDQSFLLYRTDMLQKLGKPVPTTWEDLEADAAAAVKQGIAKEGFVWQGADYEGLTCDYLEYLTDAGGKVLSSDAKTPTINSAAGLKALNFMQSLLTTGASPKAVASFQEQQSMNEFQNGNAMFLRNWAYAYGQANSAGVASKGLTGITTLPTFAGQTAPGYSTIGGWNLYLNPHSKNMAAALTFIKWMTGQTAQEMVAKDMMQIPTITSVRTDPSVSSLSPMMAVMPKNKLVARPYNTPNYAKVSQAIYDNVNAVLAGTSQPANALKTASDAINTALSGGGL